MLKHYEYNVLKSILLPEKCGSVFRGSTSRGSFPKNQVIDMFFPIRHLLVWVGFLIIK